LRFIDDGVEITEGIKKDVEYWINQFNGLRKTIKIDKWSFGSHVEYMDIYIYIHTQIYICSEEQYYNDQNSKIPIDIYIYIYIYMIKQHVCW